MIFRRGCASLPSHHCSSNLSLSQQHVACERTTAGELGKAPKSPNSHPLPPQTAAQRPAPNLPTEIIHLILSHLPDIISSCGISLVRAGTPQSTLALCARISRAWRQPAYEALYAGPRLEWRATRSTRIRRTFEENPDLRHLVKSVSVAILSRDRWIADEAMRIRMAGTRPPGYVEGKEPGVGMVAGSGVGGVLSLDAWFRDLAEAHLAEHEDGDWLGTTRTHWGADFISPGERVKLDAIDLFARSRATEALFVWLAMLEPGTLRRLSIVGSVADSSASKAAIEGAQVVLGRVAELLCQAPYPSGAHDNIVLNLLPHMHRLERLELTDSSTINCASSGGAPLLPHLTFLRLSHPGMGTFSLPNSLSAALLSTSPLQTLDLREWLHLSSLPHIFPLLPPILTSLFLSSNAFRTPSALVAYLPTSTLSHLTLEASPCPSLLAALPSTITSVEFVSSEAKIPALVKALRARARAKGGLEGLEWVRVRLPVWMSEGEREKLAEGYKGEEEEGGFRVELE